MDTSDLQPNERELLVRYLHIESMRTENGSMRRILKKAADALAQPAAASNPDSKGSEIGRPDELRFGLHGDLLLRDRSAAAVAGFAGASLVDALWNSDEVMALNAELGLTMDQLVRLSRAMLATSQPLGMIELDGMHDSSTT